MSMLKWSVDYDIATRADGENIFCADTDLVPRARRRGSRVFHTVSNELFLKRATVRPLPVVTQNAPSDMPLIDRARLRRQNALAVMDKRSGSLWDLLTED